MYESNQARAGVLGGGAASKSESSVKRVIERAEMLVRTLQRIQENGGAAVDRLLGFGPPVTGTPAAARPETDSALVEPVFDRLNRYFDILEESASSIERYADRLNKAVM